MSEFVCRWIRPLTCGVVCFLIAGLGAAETDCTVYTNGVVLTQEAAPAEATTVVTCGTEIAAVGGDGVAAEWKTKASFHDLQGATVVPGFVDSHSHLFPFGLASTWIDVSNVNPFMRPDFKPVFTNQELFERLNAQKSSDPSIPILGAAYDPTRMKDPPVTLEELDNQVSKTQRIFIWQSSMHAVSINSPVAETATELLQCLGACLPPDGSPVDEDSCPSGASAPPITKKFCDKIAEGTLEEQALMTLVPYLGELIGLGSGNPDFMAELLAKAARAGAELYARHGFTVGSDMTPSPMIDLWYEIAKNGEELPLELFLLPTTAGDCVQGREGGKWPPIPGRFQLGPVKIVSDGSPQGGTAKMREPYLRDGRFSDNFGEMNFSEDDLWSQLQEIYEAGCELAVHVNGDGAIEELLQMVRKIRTDHKDPDWKTVFIHVQFATKDMLVRMRELDVYPTFLIQHPWFWGDALCRERLGAVRVEPYDPAGWARDLGVPFSLHHDAFVTPPDPFRMMWAAVTRKAEQLPWNKPSTHGGEPPDGTCTEVLDASQRLTIEEALYALTMGAAKQWQLDASKGSIAVGKDADLAILSGDPRQYAENPDGLLAIEVLATVHRGRLWGWQPPWD